MDQQPVAAGKGKVKRMKIIAIPDSFKGSMSSMEAASAMEQGIRAAIPDAEVVKLPVADGGEGTADVFLETGIGKPVCREVTGPLGERVNAKYALLGDGTAVIEMAQASGLTLVEEARRNPMKTTTYGTGELIKDALDKGVRSIMLAVGGSATNDGGTGLAQALGISFKDAAGREIGYGCEELKDLKEIDASGMDKRLKETKIVIACDVRNTLCGENGASFVYGPQKGATPEIVREMDGLLDKLAGAVLKETGIDVRDIPGTGAAGGLAVPLIAFAGAGIVSGIETILGLIGFREHLAGADYVFTGEGRIDEQTQYGKTIAGILKMAKGKNVPVVAFAGLLGKGYGGIMEAGVKSCFCILPGAVTLQDAMENAKAYLEDCVRRVSRLLE
jgi:glycerate kinase